ncbi:hypothetical protein QL285_081566 [Trifolium repens]|nr:hypothetical protein QL285_081566 [Trifolium repens]
MLQKGLEMPLHICVPGMGPFGDMDLLRSISWVGSKKIHHQFYTPSSVEKLMIRQSTLVGEIQQTRHIIKCHCHLLRQHVEVGGLLV